MEEGSRIHDIFQKDGTVITGLFQWLFEETPIGIGPGARHTPERSPLSLMDFLHLELDMYRWHLHLEQDGKKDLGWLYNSYHSLVQQIVRCDPLYYLLYCCLGADGGVC